MVPAELETHWETAYRGYCVAARQAAAAPPDDQNVARLMVSTSAEVAAAWRDLQDVPDLPWWALAALAAAVEAFEAQARDWALRVVEPTPDDTTTTPFPRPYRHSSTVDDGQRGRLIS
ncbi:hypothetical protein [Actinophytocola sp.]|uniref:hypothetical protein n=1 Tax=Actinophytocola sp. TaxID=1872138 RepID=UPI002D7FF7B1|nr:hypothetical protein [Actinophytocola sp.]HET9142263.1 hypothetical protein [Actinophytocola sp.]